LIPRSARATLKELSKKYPVVTITGPRQSGKTTIVRDQFPNLPYVSLENPDSMEYARTDARGFLKNYPDGAIIDEVQRVPELLSYIQGIVDERRQMGMFILTGSQQFGLLEKITQSLAGRTALLELLPLSISELTNEKLLPDAFEEYIFAGSYPALYDRNLDPIQMMDDYIKTYVERDVRQITMVQNLGQFQTFLRLCAGRIGQILDVAGLASDCGISPNTASSWISVLEASYIVFRLKPHFKNFSKRMIKRPKLYFVDTGLACRLIGIRSPGEVAIHSLRGGLFESMVISEYRKAILNRKLGIDLYYWRDRTGLEVDLLFDLGSKLVPLEIKSSRTVSNSLLEGMQKFLSLAKDSVSDPQLIVGGEDEGSRMGVRILPWNKLDVQFAR
jgi:predicted AAA+ superfamily ATPase